MGKEVMGAKSEGKTNDLLTLLGEIDRYVAKWSTAEAMSEVKALLELTKCVNEVASSQGVIGAAFSVLDPSQSTISLSKTYINKPIDSEDIMDSAWRLFPYEAPADLVSRFPQFSDSLRAARTGYATFVDSLFQVQRGSQRTNDPDGMLPEFLKKDLEGAAIVSYDEICEYLAGWLFLLYSAANAKYGLLSSNAAPDLTITIGEALRRALRTTPEHTKEATLRFDDFEMYFRAFDGKEISGYDHFAKLLMECSLGDLVPSFVQQAVLKERANDLSRKLTLDLNSPIIYRLDEISQKAPFPLIPYLGLVALIKRRIAHVIIPLHSTRSFKHHVVVSEGVVQARNCGVFLLATVDEEIASIAALTPLAKAMAAPILDSVYYGGFQKKIIERELIGESIRSFSHQIRSLSGSIGGKWLVSPADWPSLQALASEKTKNLASEYNLRIDDADELVSQKANDYLTAPDPKIFSALSSTLKLWSLTFTLTDLFGSSEFGPQNANELIPIAAMYAEDCTYLRKTSGYDRTDSGDLAKLWLRRDFFGKRTIEPSELDIFRFEFSSGECDWSRPLADFKIQGSEDEPNSSRRFAMEFVGIFRLYVLAFENFILHSAESGTLRISWKTVADNRIQILWNTTGTESHDKGERLFLSLNGEEVFDFVARTFLKYRQPIVHSKRSRDKSKYWCDVEFDKPDWIITGKQE